MSEWMKWMENLFASYAIIHLQKKKIQRNNKIVQNINFLWEMRKLCCFVFLRLHIQEICLSRPHGVPALINSSCLYVFAPISYKPISTFQAYQQIACISTVHAAVKIRIRVSQNYLIF